MTHNNLIIVDALGAIGFILVLLYQVYVKSQQQKMKQGGKVNSKYTTPLYQHMTSPRYMAVAVILILLFLSGYILLSHHTKSTGSLIIPYSLGVIVFVLIFFTVYNKFRK